MANQSEPESTIPLARDTGAPMDGGQLDTASRVILKLLQKAAGAAEANSRQALQRAEHELHAAHNRIAELEALVQHYREKSERAEDWLNEILTEIEDRLINAPKAKRLQISSTNISGNRKSSPFPSHY
jgi:chromosome segregation ATPase